MDNIYYVDKNIHGAWIVCGKIGNRQYYGYSKKQAVALYIKEINDTIIVNQNK